MSPLNTSPLLHQVTLDPLHDLRPQPHDIDTRVIAPRSLALGIRRTGDIDNMYYLSENMLGRTFCPLGDAAAMPMMAFIQKFRQEFEDHLDGKPCPYERAGRMVTV